MPGNEYSIVAATGSQLGTDAIAVGLIYRAAKVAPVGSALVLDSSNSPLDTNGQPLFDDSKNRPALIQTFAANGQEFTIAVNHLKSKGSACGEANEGADGQGNCNINRTRAAQGLSEFLASELGSEQENDASVMILGDLNAYSKEDPMQVFYNAGFTNLKYTDKATEAQPYSYSFSGLLGSLDHALATDALAVQVVSVDAWHINSVEDSLADYLTEANGQTYSSVDNYAYADAYRSSDHDPIVVGLLLENPNASPELVADLPVIEITRTNQRFSLTIADYVVDADGDALNFSADVLPAGVSLSADGVISGRANRAFMDSLPVTFDVVVSDGVNDLMVTVEIADVRAQNKYSVFWQQVMNWLASLFN